jgi:predicted phage replisome organizer
MSANKKFYWLKLEAKFFDDLRIKKLRNIAGGDTYTCIYLKLMLLSLKNDGYIDFEGVYDTIEDEIAEKLSEKIENVKATLIFCEKMKMLEINEGEELYLAQIKDMTGSETASAARVRKHRESKNKALHCNTGVTRVKQHVIMCNTEKEKELEAEKFEKLNEMMVKKQISKDKQNDRLMQLEAQKKELEI